MEIDETARFKKYMENNKIVFPYTVSVTILRNNKICVSIFGNGKDFCVYTPWVT
jgi:hypothetical protein